MKVEDACITYMQPQECDDNEDWKLQRKGRILASNPIPRSMGKYSFTVGCSTPNQEFAVGFATTKKSVVYEGEVGFISKEEWKKASPGGLL